MLSTPLATVTFAGLNQLSVPSATSITCHLVVSTLVPSNSSDQRRVWAAFTAVGITIISTAVIVERIFFFSINNSCAILVGSVTMQSPYWNAIPRTRDKRVVESYSEKRLTKGPRRPCDREIS